MIPTLFGAISFPNTPTVGYPWTTRDTGGAAYDYISSAYGNGTYVMLSSFYTLVSTDGITWNSYTINVTGPFNCIIFAQRDAGPGHFVIVGATVIATSEDGITWSEQVNPLTNPETDTIYAIAQNPVDREFIALTYSQVIYTTDGGTGAASNWNLGPVYSGQGFTSATYNSSGLLVVGNYSNGILYGDYNSFTQLGLYDPITFISNSLDYNGFIACGNNKMFAISPSLTWSESVTPYSANWTSAAISQGGIAVAVNPSGNPSAGIAISTDYGANWISKSAPFSNLSSWRTVVWGVNNFNPMFAAASNNGYESNNRLITAPG